MILAFLKQWNVDKIFNKDQAKAFGDKMNQQTTMLVSDYMTEVLNYYAIAVENDDTS